MVFGKYVYSTPQPLPASNASMKRPSDEECIEDEDDISTAPPPSLFVCKGRKRQKVNIPANKTVKKKLQMAARQQQKLKAQKEISEMEAEEECDEDNEEGSDFNEESEVDDCDSDDESDEPVKVQRPKAKAPKVKQVKQPVKAVAKKKSKVLPPCKNVKLKDPKNKVINEKAFVDSCNHLGDQLEKDKSRAVNSWEQSELGTLKTIFSGVRDQKLPLGDLAGFQTELKDFCSATSIRKKKDVLLSGPFRKALANYLSALYIADEEEEVSDSE